MHLADKLTGVLEARQKTHGEDVMLRFRQHALHLLCPKLLNLVFFRGNPTKFIREKLNDGTPNPIWPEGEEVPRDEKERKDFYDALCVKQYESWIQRVEDGEFDRPPVVIAGEDKPEDLESLADEFEDEEAEAEADDEVEAKAIEARAERQSEDPETEVVSAEELEEEVDAMVKAGENRAVAEEEAKEKKTRPDQTKDDWRVSDQELAHVTAMRDLVRALIVDSPHAIRKAGGDVKGLPDLVERITQMEDTLKVMHDEVVELKKARQAAKKLLLKHVEEIKELKSALMKLSRVVAGKEKADEGDL